MSANHVRDALASRSTLQTAETQLLPPEYYRLPVRGTDPHFGLTRPFYYAAEKRGDIRLVRIKDRGKLRGITLVPYDAVRAFIRSQADAGREAA